MDELEARHRARSFLNSASNFSGDDLEQYLCAAKARLRYEAMGPNESGYTVPKGDRFVITVNSEEGPERRRFTTCHEIAHIVLGLPSAHGELPSWAYAKRDPNEVLCDMFASELLMPYERFKKEIPLGEPTAEGIEALAKSFGASFPATMSRYASLVDFPCAYVSIDAGAIRFAGLNTSLRSRGFRIPVKKRVAEGSVAHQLRGAGENGIAVREVAQDLWFENCDSAGDVCELSRHYRKFDQTLTLLWCSDDDLPECEIDRFGNRSEESLGLEELTGELTWKKRQRRR